MLIPSNEAARQAALDAFHILDTAPEDSFDDLVLIASQICDMPMGAITLIDRDRQWLKSKKGLDGNETSRNDAFCAHTILHPDQVLIVQDTHSDPRFSENPFVLEAPNLRFYAGAPLTTSDGLALGSLCVMGNEPATLTPHQVASLQALSRQVVRLLELRRANTELGNLIQEQSWYEARLREENADLSSQTKLDPLTGIGNRRAFRDAQAALSQTTAPVFMCLVDIDHFKAINDTYGHPKGDEVLVYLASLLAQATEPGHMVARLGGEEFAWLMPGLDAEQALHAADAFRQSVEDAEEGIACTVSLGLAARAPGEEWADALARADQALYEAKHTGRNRVCRTIAAA